MGLSSNTSLLALTQKKTEWTGKKAENDSAVAAQKPVVEVAGQTLDDTTKSLAHLKDLLGKTPQDNPEYTAVLDEISNEKDESKIAELNTKLKGIAKENPEYTELVKGIENLEKTKLPADEKSLETETGKAETLDKTAEDISNKLFAIEKEIEAEKKNLASEDAKYEIEVGAADNGDDKRGAKGLTNEMYRMFEDMKSAGIVTDADEFAEMTNAQKKALYQKLDAIHKESEQSTDYSKMKNGDKYTYTADQMKELAQAAGYNVVEPKKDEALDLPKIETQSLAVKPTELPDKLKTPEQVNNETALSTSLSNIKLPRGINEGASLTDFGITASTENGEVVYTSTKGDKFTAKEVNSYFRSIEESAGLDSKLLDKAEKLGIDYKGKTNDELKADIKTKEKENKAADKAAKEAEKAKTEKPEVEVKKEETKASAATSKAEAKRDAQIADYKAQLEKYGVSTSVGSVDKSTQAIVLNMRLDNVQTAAKKFIKENKDDIKKYGIDTTNKTAAQIKSELDVIKKTYDYSGKNPAENMS